jgi:hypothetical protein
MAVSYAPFDEYKPPPPPRQPIQSAAPRPPTSDDTECNYIVMAFVASIILMGIIDSFRKP